MIFILTGFLAGFAGSWIVMLYGEKIGTIDVPNNRSSHHTEIPKGAGLGILTAFVFFSIFLNLPMFFWLPAVVISLASFWGADKHILSVKHRLFIHFGCSLIFLVFFLYAKQVDAAAYIVWLPVTVFIAGTANFYNFMDGIDGIAGITGFLAFFLVTLYAGLTGMDTSYAALSLVLAFSCLGFLCFNTPRARVFLGDVGSILLGFVFACMVIVLSENLVDFVVMAGFLAPFYMDEIFTMLVRIRNKDTLTHPHRKHIYQLLANEGGIGHCKISLGYGLIQLVIGVSAMVFASKGVGFLLGLYLFYSLIFSVIAIIIRRNIIVDAN